MRRRRIDRGATTAVAIAAAVVAVSALSSACQPQPGVPRRAMVASDSILAESDPFLGDILRGQGWEVQLDAKVSRPTSDIAEIVASNRGAITDTLIVSAGANDAGNASTFRSRVDAVMQAAEGVPHVYWLTIREVRDYYPAANQVLRDATARYPNLGLIDWNAASAGRSDLTASDGLHLKPSGGRELGALIVGEVTRATLVPPPSEPSVAPSPSVPPPPMQDAAAPTVPPAPAAAAPPATATVPAVSTTSIAPTTVRPAGRSQAAADGPVAANTRDSSGSQSSAAGTAARSGLVAVVLAGALLLILRRPTHSSAQQS